MPPKRAKATRASIHEDTVEAQTPEQSPGKTMTGITEAQKQALVDNLQLESTNATILRIRQDPVLTRR